MKWCNDCKEPVEVIILSEFIGEPEHGGYEYTDVCSVCGQDDLEDVSTCELCSELMPDNGEDYCDECKNEVRKYISDGISHFDREIMMEAMEEEINR